MASAGFTRDEVILALDGLYSSEKHRVSADSQAMIDLSSLLNRLPIHPMKDRRADFRSATGIAQQIGLYRASCSTGKRSPDVGGLFFDVAFEFEDRQNDLHSIAAAIRKNEPYFTWRFGSRAEDAGFPEGILLGHLHRLIETRDGATVPTAECCEVCSLKPELCYQSCGELLQKHLLVSPTETDGSRRYPANNFITVCPTCHAVLHRLRPWRTKENYGDMLR